MIIRQATEKDIRGILDMHLRLYAHHREFNPLDLRLKENRNLSKKWIEKRIRDKENTAIFLAETDNIILGYIMCEIEKRRGVISEIYVLPENRNNNIGEKLINTGEEYFKKKKKSKIMTTTPVNNLRGIGFWLKLNFNKSKQQPQKSYLDLEKLV